MMSREQMLQILAAADTNKLKQACGALGIDCGYATGDDGMHMGSPDDPLESWNDTRIAMPESKRPELFNRRGYLKPIEQTQPMTRRMDYMPQEEGTEDFSMPGMATGVI